MHHFKVYTAFLVIVLWAGCSGCSDSELKNIASPAGVNSRLPHLTADQSGNIFMSWVEKDSVSGNTTLLYSSLKKDRWSKPKIVAQGSNWFINWADYPTISASNGHLVAAHVLDKIPGNTYSYDVNIFLRKPDGTWSSPRPIHFDSTATEHGFVSITPWNDDILAIWLDGRQTNNRTEQEYFDISKAMTLRSAVITNTGEVTQKHLIDDSVCDCCNTSIAFTDKGPVAVYRNRTGNEIRDIYITRFAEGAWTKPRAVHVDNWHIAACPVNGPAVAARGSTVVVAWYTAAEGKSKVKAAVSTDSGNTFSRPIIISENNPLGRVDAVIAENGKAYISWMGSSRDGAGLKVAGITSDLTLGKALKITEMNSDRQSGFPQMETTDKALIFAWTATGSTGTSIKTAALSYTTLR